MAARSFPPPPGSGTRGAAPVSLLPATWLSAWCLRGRGHVGPGSGWGSYTGQGCGHAVHRGDAQSHSSQSIPPSLVSTPRACTFFLKEHPLAGAAIKGIPGTKGTLVRCPAVLMAARHISSRHLCMSVQAQGCMCVQAQRCLCVQTQGCMCVQAQGCMCVQAQGCMCVQAHGCLCVHACH